MGSKKLKAVVVKGNKDIKLQNPDKMKELRKKHVSVFREGLGELLSTYGTCSLYKGAVHSGDAPVKNWSSSVEEMKNPDGIDENSVLKYQVKRYACSGCPIGCGGHLEIKNGPFKTESLVHKVEYETMGMFGSNLLNENIESLIKITDLCNRYGLDAISCGSLCGFAIECFENGLINKEQTDGVELKWGDPLSIVYLVEKIGKGEGIGKILSQGFKASIEVFGKDSEKYAMAVRNEAFPAHDPRWSASLALTYFSEPTPSRHTQGSITFPVGGYEMPQFPSNEPSGWSNHFIDNTILTQALNAAGLCLFGFIISDYKTLPDFLEAADGEKWTIDEIKKIGLRIYLLRHIFNLRAGIIFKEFNFPARVLGNPPLKSGETKDVRIDLDTMTNEFIDEINFDKETLLPSKEILEELKIYKYVS